MQVPQPAAFLGLPFELWVMIFMAALAAYAAVVATRRKRQSFVSLGDEKHHVEPHMETAADWAEAKNALSPEALESGPPVKSPPIASSQPETRR
jgi:hypothetical protein